MIRRKIITINYDHDMNKLIKNLKYYKSLIYHNTQFIIKNNLQDKNIELIMHALNIKNRKKRIEYIYQQACNLIDENNKEKNICGFKNNKCYVQRKLANGKCNGCCRKCLYQSEKGCTTRNLACKLFNCSEVKSRHKTFNSEDLKILNVLSLKNQFIVKSDYFSKEEDVLKDLYCYTYIFSTIRIIYRLIRNNIFLRKRRKQIKNN